MISGDIPTNEFSRFCELARFVQAVVPQYDCVCESVIIDSGTWHYLARVSPGDPLFPSLRELHWTIQDPSDTGILFLVPPSLRRLTICYSGCSGDSREWTLSQEMLFRTIFSTAPQLTQLIIRDIDGALLPACLANARVLRELRVHSLEHRVSVDLDTLRAMSSMESLEELSFNFDALEDFVDFSGFSALKKLEMTVLSGSARPILDAFSSPNLRKLTLNSEKEALTADEASATSTMLAQGFPSMEVLTWSFSVRDDVPLESALAPLFPLRLAKVSLKVRGLSSSTLSDNLFAIIARSWPGLVELSINIPSQRNEAGLLPSVTAHTLLAFSRGCPRLQTLRLPRMLGPQPETVDTYPVLQHALRTLVVDEPGLVGDAEYVTCALVLDRLFPDLDTTLANFGGYGPVSSPWWRMMSSVQLCQLARTNRTS